MGRCGYEVAERLHQQLPREGTEAIQRRLVRVVRSERRPTRRGHPVAPQVPAPQVAARKAAQRWLQDDKPVCQCQPSRRFEVTEEPDQRLPEHGGRVQQPAVHPHEGSALGHHGEGFRYAQPTRQVHHPALQPQRDPVFVKQHDRTALAQRRHEVGELLRWQRPRARPVRRQRREGNGELMGRGRDEGRRRARGAFRRPPDTRHPTPDTWHVTLGTRHPQLPRPLPVLLRHHRRADDPPRRHARQQPHPHRALAGEVLIQVLLVVEDGFVFVPWRLREHAVNEPEPPDPLGMRLTGEEVDPRPRASVVKRLRRRQCKQDIAQSALAPDKHPPRQRRQRGRVEGERRGCSQCARLPVSSAQNRTRKPVGRDGAQCLRQSHGDIPQ